MTKPKWQVKWWCDKSDSAKTRGFHTHEEAVTWQHKIKQKFNRRADISLRGAK